MMSSNLFKDVSYLSLLSFIRQCLNYILSENAWTPHTITTRLPDAVQERFFLALSSVKLYYSQSCDLEAKISGLESTRVQFLTVLALVSGPSVIHLISTKLAAV